MKIQVLIPLALAMGLSAVPAGFAFADDDSAMRDQAHRQAQNANLRRQGLPPQYAPNDPRYQTGRGIGERRYYQGDYLPPEYRNRSYIVDDWRGHRLEAPPRGYHWMQVGRDYALVANSWRIYRWMTPGGPPDETATAQ